MVCLVVESAELKRHTFCTGAVLLTGVMAWGCLFLLISDCIGTALNNLLSKKALIHIQKTGYFYRLLQKKYSFIFLWMVHKVFVEVIEEMFG